MQVFEYKVIPAPNKGKKAKGVKTPVDRFANGVETILNEMAAEGWEFQRAEMLPSDERSGLAGSKTNWRNLLVFRRVLRTEASEETPAPLPAEPGATAASAATTTSETSEAAQSTARKPPLTAIAGDPEAPPEAVQIPGQGAREMISDDGVEELSPVSGLTAALKQRAGLKDPAKAPEDG
ncbi:MAG: DUF4177 domain-containing protein [Epibacterium sp.]|nr:DUF4177 domain-containing protein [Epibacterium sp.]NQX72070.1 DUF4177 domain-containing protein [Epibacterium sp.]